MGLIPICTAKIAVLGGISIECGANNGGQLQTYVFEGGNSQTGVKTVYESDGWLRVCSRNLFRDH